MAAAIALRPAGRPTHHIGPCRLTARRPRDLAISMFADRSCRRPTRIAMRREAVRDSPTPSPRASRRKVLIDDSASSSGSRSPRSRTPTQQRPDGTLQQSHLPSGRRSLSAAVAHSRAPFSLLSLALPLFCTARTHAHEYAITRRTRLAHPRSRGPQASRQQRNAASTMSLIAHTAPGAGLACWAVERTGTITALIAGRQPFHASAWTICSSPAMALHILSRRQKNL